MEEVILVLVSSFFAAVSCNSVIVKPFPVANVTHGSQLQFNCTFSDGWMHAALEKPNEEGSRFSIFKQGPCIVSDPNKRSKYSIACNGNTVTFGVTNPVDQEIWICAGGYTSFRKDTIFGNVTVNIRPGLPTTIIPKNTYVVTEHQKVDIPCNFTGSPVPNIVWKYGNVSLPYTEDPNNKMAILHLKNMLRNQTGNYTCEATVTFKGIHMSAKGTRVVVQFAPDVTVNDLEQVQNTGKAVFTCKADGFPSVYNLTGWKHFVDGQLIRNLASGHSNVVLSDDGFVLTLHNVSSQDAGYYECSVQNGILNTRGVLEQTGSGYLSVFSKPQLINFQHVYAEEEGRSLRIRFESIGNPVPQMNISEYSSNIGVNVTRNSPITVKVYDVTTTVNGTVLELIFETLPKNFKKNFTLITENSLGRIPLTFTVESHVLPLPPFDIHALPHAGAAEIAWKNDKRNSMVMYEIEYKKEYSTNMSKQYVNGTGDETQKSQLTNLEAGEHYIVKICAVNVLGRACTTTIKMTIPNVPVQSSLEGSNGSDKAGSYTVYACLGAAVLIAALVIVVLLVKFRRKKYSDMVVRLTRPNDGETFRRENSYSRERLTVDIENSIHRSNNGIDGYLSPSCMQRESASSTSQLGMNEYASVDDPKIARMAQQRKRQDESPSKNEKFSCPALPNRAMNGKAVNNTYMSMNQVNDNADKKKPPLGDHYDVYQGNPVLQTNEEFSYMSMGENKDSTLNGQQMEGYVECKNTKVYRK